MTERPTQSDRAVREETIRVLCVARYHQATAEHKIELMAREAGLRIALLRPNAWRDEYGAVRVPVATGARYSTLAVPTLGRPNDPHRMLYASLTFGLLRWRPDIIHVEEEPDSLAALQVALARRLLAPRAKLIVHTWQNINRAKKWHVSLVTRLVLAAADAVLCANQEAVSVLSCLGYRRPTSVISPQGVDLRVFRPATQRQQAANFVIAYVGRFVPEKGLDTLIAAFGRLGHPAQLWLIGDGPSRPSLQAEVARAGLAEAVLFVDPLPPPRLVERLHAVDVLVLPSRTTAVWKEQFGRVLVEAMACKVPVVGSSSGAIPEVVGDAGLIFPEGDALALSSCLRRLIESKALRDELAERGYARALTMYSQERIAAQTAAFYRWLSRRPA